MSTLLYAAAFGILGALLPPQVTAALVGILVLATTRDPVLAGAAYRGSEAWLKGASVGESLKAATKGYQEGAGLANGDIRSAISLTQSGPSYDGGGGGIEIDGSSKSNLSQNLGILFRTAALILTIVSATTGAKSNNAELTQSAKQTNEIHLTWDQAITRLTDRVGVGAPSGNILASSSSPGGGMIPPAADGAFVPGSGYAQAVNMAMGVPSAIPNVLTRGKPDIRQLNKAAKKAGIKDRRGFGDFIEAVKDSLGWPPDKNFSWKELLKQAKNFKDGGGE